MVPERHVLVELGHFVGHALVPAPFEAERRRTEAQHYADRATAHADRYHAGPDEPQLDRFEALLAGAHERYDQAQRYRTQAHVQQRVGRHALLQLVQPPVGPVERQGVVDLIYGTDDTIVSRTVGRTQTGVTYTTKDCWITTAVVFETSAGFTLTDFCNCINNVSACTHTHILGSSSVSVEKLYFFVIKTDGNRITVIGIERKFVAFQSEFLREKTTHVSTKTRLPVERPPPTFYTIF